MDFIVLFSSNSHTHNLHVIGLFYSMLSKAVTLCLCLERGGPKDPNLRVEVLIHSHKFPTAAVPRTASVCEEDGSHSESLVGTEPACLHPPPKGHMAKYTSYKNHKSKHSRAAIKPHTTQTQTPMTAFANSFSSLPSSSFLEPKVKIHIKKALETPQDMWWLPGHCPRLRASSSVRSLFLAHFHIRTAASYGDESLVTE